MAFCYTTGAPALITRPGAARNIAISRTDAGLNGAAILTWDAAPDGLGNPVHGYRIFCNGVAMVTVEDRTQTVYAPAADGRTNAYTIQALGRVAGQDGPVSDAVTLCAHAPYKEDYHYTENATITIPLWTERMAVTCIGGGGFGGLDAYNYDIGNNQLSSGAGAGGTGEKKDATFERGAFTPGAEIAITVGAAGDGYGGGSPSGEWSASGGASSFGDLLSARGGQGGETPGTIYTWYGGQGGRGGAGGIGGPGGPGTNHAIAQSGADWNDWQSWTDAQWYVLCDAETGKRLGTSGKSGSGWCGAGKTPARGNTTLPGAQYGKGGNGWARYYIGDQNQESDKPTGGIVSVRFWRYLE